ncbi:MAG: glutathione S-transferase family protein [Pseudomonadota bacterium]
MSLQLHQFAFSHFNEKARWALSFKQLDHERIDYLPGPHMRAIKQISGQTQTPVLQSGAHYIPGSADIIDYLEQTYPEPALYPQDPAAREAALQLQQHWDTEVGPAVRSVVFSSLVNNGNYLVSMFASSKGRLKQLAYRATLPLARPLIAKGNGVDDPANVRRCFVATQEALDDVVSATAGTGYMVGDSFSVADLTVAALLAPIADVAHPDMCRPKPMPADFAAIIGQFSDHPGVAWVNSIYARHR